MHLVKRILLFLAVGFLIGIVYYKAFEPEKYSTRMVDLGLEKTEEAYLEEFASSEFIEDDIRDFNENIASSRQNAITTAIKRVFPSVVGINVRSVAYRRGNFSDLLRGNRYRAYQTSSVGSGFVITEDGYIVTNAHVISNATEIMVSFPSGEKFAAEKIGADSQSDIALIKIVNSDNVFTPVDLGDSSELMLGEWAIAIGNPFGLNDINSQPTVTLGIISGLDKDFGHIEGEQTVYYNMIQTDAAINSGNSGGPLVSAAGEVIGMNTFIYTGGSGGRGNVGIAFAIPINDILKTVQQLEQGDIERDVETGVIPRYEITPRLAAEYALPVNYGLIVWNFSREDLAYGAGMRRGDIIVEVNGQRIETRRDFNEAINFSGHRVGDAIEIKAYRSKQLLVFRFKLGKRGRR